MDSSCICLPCAMLCARSFVYTTCTLFHLILTVSQWSSTLSTSRLRKLKLRRLSNLSRIQRQEACLSRAQVLNQEPLLPPNSYLSQFIRESLPNRTHETVRNENVNSPFLVQYHLPSSWNDWISMYQKWPPSSESLKRRLGNWSVHLKKSRI